MSKKINYYPACEHIQRPIPHTTITKEIADAMGRDYRTLPIFEKGLYEYTYRKHYSLQSNEYLKCRWAEYKRLYEERVFAPVQFIDAGDYHFYNYSNRIAPLESITKRADQRRKLRAGPGVDALGQIPIPNELIMKRGPNKPQERVVRSGINAKNKKHDKLKTQKK